MKYGYARVSTLVQLKGNSLEDQRQKLKEAGVPEENIVTEQYSGKTTSRPKFQELIAKLQSGDELFCTKLDRFARNAEEGQRVIRELTERNVAVYILNIGGNRHPFDNSAIGKLQYEVLLAACFSPAIGASRPGCSAITAGCSPCWAPRPASCPISPCSL